jgi:hypothetical protein
MAAEDFDDDDDDDSLVWNVFDRSFWSANRDRPWDLSFTEEAPAAQAQLRVPRPIRLDRVIASDWDYDALGIPENNRGECVIVLAVVMINSEIDGC